MVELAFEIRLFLYWTNKIYDTYGIKGLVLFLCNLVLSSNSTFIYTHTVYCFSQIFVTVMTYRCN